MTTSRSSPAGSFSICSGRTSAIVLPCKSTWNFFAASNIDRPIKVKGQQTAEQVVETALSAVKSGRTKVVSGVANRVGAMLGTYVPSSISRRVMAKALRSRFQKGE